MKIRSAIFGASAIVTLVSPQVVFAQASTDTGALSVEETS